MTSHNTTSNTTLAMLYVNEFDSEINPKNGKTRMTSHPSWYTGIKVNNVLYVKRNSDYLIGEECDVLVINSRKCNKYAHSREYADFEAFQFASEPDILLKEHHDVRITSFDTLESGIQDALLEAIELYENRRVGA